MHIHTHFSPTAPHYHRPTQVSGFAEMDMDDLQELLLWYSSGTVAEEEPENKKGKYKDGGNFEPRAIISQTSI